MSQLGVATTGPPAPTGDDTNNSVEQYREEQVSKRNDELLIFLKFFIG